MKWRRCCIDIDEAGAVIGASIEFYDDTKLKPNCVFVLARSEWLGRMPSTVLADERLWAWPDEHRGVRLIGFED
jgi:hypothetical protein